MNKNFLFALGGIIFFAASAFLGYRLYHEATSSQKDAAISCDQSSGDCGKKKEVINDSSQNNEVGNVPSEQKPNEGRVIQESKNNSSDDLDSDVVLNKNKEKFNSDKDDEKETDDGVTVEVESDDE
jgi:hypothetical protein